MTRKLAIGCCAALLGFVSACSQSNKETERQRAAEAKEKTRRATERAREETKKLGQELKQEARDLDRNVNRALQGTGPQGGGTGQADEKLRDGGEKLREAGNRAGDKLDHAAMIAKVKAKLATDVGLSTVTGVDVDATGQVVTLRGTVSSEEQKQQAEQAVKQLSGVTTVINNLRVK